MRTGIIVDGVFYACRVSFPSLSRTFNAVDGGQGGTSLTGGTIRDVLGTAYSYQMTIDPDPRNRGDYDLLHALLSNQEESHIVTAPFGQRTITFRAYVTSGTDTYQGKQGGVNLWSGLTINIVPIEPQSNGEEIIGKDISFYIDFETGELHRVTSPGYSGANITLNQQTGNLEVS